MGATKTEHYSDLENKMAVLTKALGHPARMKIVAHLLKVGECICNDLVDELPLAQPTISQHLRELKSVGLIKGNIDGSAICYCVDRIVLGELTQYLGGLLLLSNEKISSECC